VSLKSTVRVTDYFEQRLEDIAAFLQEAEAPQAFDALLDELTETVIPNLERFPGMGRPFLVHPSRSVEARNRLESLQNQLRCLDPKVQLREYVLSHYLVLYAVHDQNIDLLSIRHHRQLSFAFQAIWSAPIQSN
jgi:plasmid stabilization system protein ParE